VSGKVWCFEEDLLLCFYDTPVHVNMEFLLMRWRYLVLKYEEQACYLVV
jgi:hypothetical protein